MFSDRQCLSLQPVPLPFLTASTVLALVTLAVFPTAKTSLEALAIFLQAEGLLAVASFQVLVLIDFLTEGIRIAFHQHQDCVVSLLLILLQIPTSVTITAITSLIDPKAIAIKFETFRLLTVAEDFLGAKSIIGLLQCQLFQQLFLLHHSFRELSLPLIPFQRVSFVLW